MSEKKGTDIATKAGVLIASTIIGASTLVGCDSPIQTKSLEIAKQTWQAQDEAKQRQEAKKTVDSGNIQVDQLIKDAIDKGVSQEVDPAKLRTAKKDSSFESDEIFLIQPGTTYIKGKLTMGAYDKLTNKFYKIDEVLNYEKNPTPIWVFNEIYQDPNVNTGARFVMAFQNDGINPAQVLEINNKNEFLSLMSDPTDKKVPGTYNVVNFTNNTITVGKNEYSFFSEIPNDIFSVNFDHNRNTTVDSMTNEHNDSYGQEILTTIHNASTK